MCAVAGLRGTRAGQGAGHKATCRASLSVGNMQRRPDREPDSGRCSAGLGGGA